MTFRTNETQLVCIARFTANKNEEKKLLKNLHDLLEATHQEGGCIRYELNQSVDNPEVITFVEKWADQKTFDEHCDKPYITGFFKDGNPDYVESFNVSLHKEILP